MARETQSMSRRPAAPPVPCDHCRTPVDPLRAPRISATELGFLHFCSESCRDAYFRQASGLADVVTDITNTPESLIERRDSQHELQRALHEVAQPIETDAYWSEDAHSDSFGAAEEGPAASTHEPLVKVVQADVDPGTLLMVLSTLAGVLSLALSLAGDTGAALIARVILASVSSALLVFELLIAPRARVGMQLLLQIVPSVALTAVAAITSVVERGEASMITNAACLVTIAAAANVMLLRRCRGHVEYERRELARVLETEAHRFHQGNVTIVDARDLRPGEEVVAGPGDVVPADGVVVAGQAQVIPWHQSDQQCSLSEGAPVVAGARVVEGRLRIVVSWSGFDRAWLRLTVDPRRRADIHGFWAKSGQLVAFRLAPIVAGLTALTAYAAAQSPYAILAITICAYSVFCSAGLIELPALHVARAVFAALRRGIAFRSSDALDVAGRVSTATFCARGTLLLGEPEVTSIDPFGSNSPERVLELASGAHSTSSDPAATALLRAARGRGLRPDAVRSPTAFPGLGVTAVASDGQRLIVGSRGLMLKEYVSIALAESKIADLESLGRSVLLVALGGRIVGLIGLQDGLRAGARAAVQHLLDVNIEPVLLSGDTRETCEALGQALDIDHVRPEVLPADRGEEIKRLVEGGATVAVIGRSPVDDATLAAADLAIALNCAGGTSTDWHVQLASDDVRDAASSLRIGHHLRKELMTALLLCLGTAAAGATGIAFMLLPVGAAPVLALMGVGASVYRWYSASN